MLHEVDNVSFNSSRGIYTYCLTRMQKSFPHPVVGIDDKHEVYYAEHNGLFAVVSNVSLSEFNEDVLEKNMTDVVWLAPMVKRHEEIVEFVMFDTPVRCSKPYSSYNYRQPLQLLLTEQLYTPVVPLRFCTIYRNQDSLFQAIMPYREEIMQFLDYTAHKAEWSIKVFYDKVVFVNSYSDSEKDHSYEFDRNTALLPGESYFLTKKKQKIQEETCKADIQRILEDIYYTVSQYADRSQPLRCTRRDIHGKPRDMVMNAAFLIERRTFNSFQNTVNSLAERYRDRGIVFEFSGPWPPYSFCPKLQPGC